MTLDQLHALKLWHVAHKRERPIEYHAWDGVLTVWLIGWMGEPAALILWWPGVALGCVLLFFAPTLYVALRRHLHRTGRLRCDWLDSLGR
ncbi:MAG TPA: hypothetical protein VFL64_08900 [Rhizobacter sp.]|nr:hypothetical protein [Rhizobacter sp.]HSC79723.1 hypothetical protein [Chitinolyticbacter sp.]